MTDDQMFDMVDNLNDIYYNSESRLEGLEGFSLGKSDENPILVVMVQEQSNIKHIDSILSGVPINKMYRVIGKSVIDASDSNEALVDKLKEII